MRKFVRVGAMMLLGASLLLNFTACCDGDPDYDDVTPPVVAVAPTTLTGVVTGISGDVLSGATVTLGNVTATTDFQGVYLFKDVKAGTYAIKAEVNGYQSKADEITVTDTGKSQNLVWNAVLAKEKKQEVTASATAEAETAVETEALKGNEKAEVKVDLEVPAAAVENAAGQVEEVEIIISPIYHADDAAARADAGILMVGASLSASKTGVTLKKPVELGFNVDDEVATSVEAKQYVNGRWVPVASRVENGTVVIDATEFTSYGLFLGVKFSASGSSVPVTFATSEWNNLYGGQPLLVDDASYTYKVGTEITSRGTSIFTALLIEKLAQRYGATVTTATGLYPLNLTLPIGTALTVNGVQSTQSVSASALGRTVSGTTYGTVTVVAATYNREHTGGGSGN